MTDNNEQALNELIEKLLAGEQLPLDKIDDDRIAALASLASELHEGRAEPTAEFQEALARRIGELGQDERHGFTKPDRSAWMPGWVTWRRAAAVAATLVLGLGIAGMSRAVISGTSPLTENKSVAITADDTRSAEAENRAAGEAGQYSPAGVPESTAPVDMNTESAGLAATEALPNGNLTVPELRRVIQTADYEVEVPVGDFQDRFREIADIAARYGGYVISSSSSVSDNEDDKLKQGVISVRIANTGDNFNLAQKDIEGLGKVIAKEVSGNDVTEEYVDLQSRLRNAESQQASLLALMEKAATIDEILMVQSRLDQVQMEIEQLKGSIQYMESMTDFATITVELREEDVKSVDDPAGEDGTDWGFVAAIRYAGWLAVQTVNFVIIALGIIIPALLIIGLVTLIAYRVIQRRRRD